MLQCINCFFAFFLKTNCEKRKSTKNISLQEWLYFMFEGFLIIFVITMANVKNLFFYFLLPISRESIVFRLNFRNDDSDRYTRFEITWIQKWNFQRLVCVCCRHKAWSPPCQKARQKRETELENFMHFRFFSFPPSRTTKEHRAENELFLFYQMFSVCESQYN